MKWNYVKDGNPTKEGVYWVCLLFPEYNDGPTGRTAAEINTRWFGTGEGWRMEGEPETGLAWHEETGSYYHEKVYAWAEHEEPPFPDVLPDGVVKYEE